jgi:hypothetical protein
MTSIKRITLIAATLIAILSGTAWSAVDSVVFGGADTTEMNSWCLNSASPDNEYGRCYSSGSGYGYSYINSGLHSTDQRYNCGIVIPTLYSQMSGKVADSARLRLTVTTEYISTGKHATFIITPMVKTLGFGNGEHCAAPAGLNDASWNERKEGGIGTDSAWASEGADASGDTVMYASAIIDSFRVEDGISWDTVSVRIDTAMINYLLSAGDVTGAAFGIYLHNTDGRPDTSRSPLNIPGGRWRHTRRGW